MKTPEILKKKPGYEIDQDFRGIGEKSHGSLKDLKERLTYFELASRALSLSSWQTLEKPLISDSYPDVFTAMKILDDFSPPPPPLLLKSN